MKSGEGEVRISVILDSQDAARYIDKLRTEFNGLKPDKIEEIDKAVGDFDKSTEKAGDGFTVFKGIVANLSTAAIMAAKDAVVDFAKETIETGKQFTTSMSKVEALSGATAEELEALEAKAREMGAQTTFSASEAADALGYMALAGWDTQSMIAGLPGVLSLAQAGEMDLAAASDLVTDYLSAFNMKADETGRMVDVLAYAQANANTTTEGLGEAFKNCSANANAAGLDVETTSAAISMMANQGVKGARAGTQLNAVMRDMTAKMKDGKIAIGKTNVEVMDSQGNYRDFADILSDVQNATNGMGDAQRASALQATFTQDSINGLNLLLNAGSDELISFREELYNCGGTAQETADTMTDNLGGDLAEFNSAMEETQLKLYDALQVPLRNLVQFLTSNVVPGIEAVITNLDTIVPAVVAAGVAFVAFKAILWASEVGIKGMQVSLKSLQATLKGVAVSFASLGPQILAILAITAVIECIMQLVNVFEEAREHEEKLEKATTGLTDAFSNVDDSANRAQDALNELDTGDAVKSVSELSDAIDDAIERQSELADSIAEDWGKINADASVLQDYMSVVERLTNKYDENRKKAKLTAKEQSELQLAIGGINEIMGTSYSVVDAVNGKLNVSSKELQTNADAWIANAEAQAIANEMTKLKQEQLQNEQTNNDLLEKQAKLQQTINDLKGKQGIGDFASEQALENAWAELDEVNAKLEENGQLMQSNADAQAWLVSKQQETSVAIGKTKDSLGEYITSNKAFKDALGGSTENIEKASQKLSELGISTTQLADLTPKQVKVLAKSFNGSAADIEKACKKVGLTVPEELGKATEEGAKAIEDNKGKVEDATANMAEGAADAANSKSGEMANAGEAGGSEYVSGIENSAGDAQAAAASVSDEAASGYAQSEGVTENSGGGMSDNFTSGIQNGQDGAVAAASTVSKQVADHFSLSNGDAWWAGYNMAEGMAKGIEDGQYKVVEAARKSVRKAAKAAKDEGEIKSPSRLFKREVGVMIARGTAEGMESEADRIYDAGKSMILSINDGMLRSVPVLKNTVKDISNKLPLTKSQTGFEMEIDWFASKGSLTKASMLGIDSSKGESLNALQGSVSNIDNRTTSKNVVYNISVSVPMDQMKDIMTFEQFLLILDQAKAGA